MADLRLAPVAALVPVALVALFALPAVIPATAPSQHAPATTLVKARVVAPDHVRLQFDGALRRTDPANFRFTEAAAPDAPVPVTRVESSGDGVVTLTVAQTLRAADRYHLEVAEPPVARDVAPSTWALLLTVFLSSALINNFVFTRYLGLCIFFGVSKRTETAVGMGITFTAVMIFTAMTSWAVDTYVLQKLHLGFLQVLVFIGTVAAVVQFLDTMLKKTHPALHKGFGVYLMLITTNCVILAVPLLNAGAHASFPEALALAVGSGLGFALALFLMSCAREKLELARVPKSFEGLPIAFALAGLFALAFMGFSGLDFFR
jgi:electron transport complex protein RnfA